MAHFIGYVQGQRGEASRLGSASSGITTRAQGWNSGVTVYGSADRDSDTFAIYKTGGSNRLGGEILIGYLIDGEFHPHHPALSGSDS